MTSMGIVSSSSTLVADRGRLCRGFLDANVFCRTTTSLCGMWLVRACLKRFAATFGGRASVRIVWSQPRSAQVAGRNGNVSATSYH